MNTILTIINQISLKKDELNSNHDQILSYETEQKINKLTDKLVGLYEKNIVAYQKALIRMRELEHNDDFESAHREADNILKDILRGIGCTELVESFNKVGKWYA